MATQSDFTRLNILKEAGIPAAYFARYTGIHRVTISQWVNNHTPSARPVYWQRANQVLDLIAKGVQQGVFPLKQAKKKGYDSFAAAMSSLAA